MSREYLLSEKGIDFKANLHSHTNLSDGNRTPLQVKEQYMEKGYSVVAYTDHDVFVRHNDLTDDKFVALNGFEAEWIDWNEKIATYRRTTHLNMIALDKEIRFQPCYHREKYLFFSPESSRELVEFDENEPDFVREYGPENINLFIKKCKEKNFFVTYNHPHWSLETVEDYGKYKGMDALEIINGAGMESGMNDICEHSFDEILRKGNNIFAVAGDDNHFTRERFWAWTNIRAEKLTYENIAQSLKDGNFYATNGPEIKELYVEDGKLCIKTSEAKYIRFQTGHRHFNNCFNDDGSPKTEASFEINYEDDGYVRAIVEDFEGHFAFSNPYFIKK